MEYNYLFSVIIPIYNVEEYLRETLESVVQQSIGFKKNIQLILVNDSSPDRCDQICAEYVKRFPENVIYLEKENGGVSSARNFGIKYVEGKYVTFLDSDDKWDLDAFEKAYKFFEENYDQIDVLAARIHFFGAKTMYHILDYKFDDGSRVVDLDDRSERFSIQSTAATTFIKSSAIGDLRFDGRLKYGEDSTFINKLILKKKKYGLLREAEYLYRRRNTADSAVNVQTMDKSFYTDSLMYYHKELENYSIRLYGEVITYIQSVIYYDLAWRLLQDDYKKVLDAQEQKKYFESLKQELQCVDNSIIMRNRVHKSIYKKAMACRLKNDEDCFSQMEYKRKTNKLKYHKSVVIDFNTVTKGFVIVDILDIQDGVVKIEGRVCRWLLNCTQAPPQFVIRCNKEDIEPEISEYKHKKVKAENGMEEYFYRFKAVIDLDACMREKKSCDIRMFLKFGTKKVALMIDYGKFLPDVKHLESSYQCIEKYCIRNYHEKISIVRIQRAFRFKVKKEYQCIKELFQLKRGDLAWMRIKYYLGKFLKGKKKEIWLISDRMDNAGDNGEVFFKYVCSLNLKNVEPIFVIGKDAKVVPRLKRIGKVIFFEEKKYKLYFLMADKIISSGAAEFTINAFGQDRKYLSDLYHFKYYYLQHGVACADLSSWLNKYNKNISMIFTSSPSEKKAFVEGDYYYDDKQIVLTGMSRFDELKSGDKKQILILPTWRRSIKESYDAATNSVYYDGFKDTEYFKFYNNLINDERLLNVMKEYGYTGLFCLHPIHKEQYIDYQANDVFTVNEGFVDYNKCFSESSLMVTDYSSVLFDFAYLRKPVLYAQFDKEEFFAGQIYDEGYFSYEKDGFGPVCYDYESTVNTMIEYIKQGCRNSEKYLERVNAFFAFNDNKNAERIYDKIIHDHP